MHRVGPLLGSVQVTAQVQLKPTHLAPKASGVATLLRRGGSPGIILNARGLLPATPSKPYAIWLCGPRLQGCKLVGYVNQNLSRNGTVRTQGLLPVAMQGLTRIVLARQTSQPARMPEQIVLAGSQKRR